MWLWSLPSRGKRRALSALVGKHWATFHHLHRTIIDFSLTPLRAHSLPSLAEGADGTGPRRSQQHRAEDVKEQLEGANSIQLSHELINISHNCVKPRQANTTWHISISVDLVSKQVPIHSRNKATLASEDVSLATWRRWVQHALLSARRSVAQCQSALWCWAGSSGDSLPAVTSTLILPFLDKIQFFKFNILIRWIRNTSVAAANTTASLPIRPLTKQPNLQHYELFESFCPSLLRLIIMSFTRGRGWKKMRSDDPYQSSVFQSKFFHLGEAWRTNGRQRKN